MIEKRLRNVVISGFGYKLRCKDNLLEIEGEESVKISPKEIEQVIITGEVSLTSGAVRLLLKNKVDLVFVEHRPNFFARVVSQDSNFITDLWRKQIVMTDERKMEIAREIVDCLIYNKLRMLQHLEKNRNVDFSDGINKLIQKRENILSPKSRSELMGIEGDVTKIYFSSLRKILPEELGFVKRVRHPPLDPINSLLSYGYTVLLSRVTYAIMLAALNPYEGILHETYRDRAALAYDLMEEFRQAIVDRVVLTEVVRGRVRKDDFDFKPEMCYIKEDFKRNYLDALYTRFENKYTYYGKSMEFLDIIFEQAKKLAEAIGKDVNYKGFRYR